MIWATPTMKELHLYIPNIPVSIMPVITRMTRRYIISRGKWIGYANASTTRLGKRRRGPLS